MAIVFRKSFFKKLKESLNKIPSPAWKTFWSGIGILLYFVLENKDTLNLPNEYAVILSFVVSTIFERYSKYQLVQKDRIKAQVDEFLNGKGEKINN